MRDHEIAMRVYVQLAAVSDQKRQFQVRDRFLVLAGAAACRAGWLEVAERCRARLLVSNPAHQLLRHATFPDAMRDRDFQQLATHWEHYCPFEKAEALVRQLNLPPEEPTDQTVGEQMLLLLTDAPENLK